MVGIDLDVDVRQSLDIGQLGLVVGGRLRLVRDDDRKNPKVTRPQVPQMEIGDAIALGLEPVADQHGCARLGTASSRTPAADLMRLYADIVITIIPMNPAVGSSQRKPRWAAAHDRSRHRLWCCDDGSLGQRGGDRGDREAGKR